MLVYGFEKFLVYVNTVPIVTNVSTSANMRNKSEASNFFIEIY